MRYTDEDVKVAVKDSTSIRQVLNKLGLKPAGGNYKSIKFKIDKLNLDTSHFLGKASNKDKKFGFKRPICDYLSNSHKITSHNLRVRLINEGIFKAMCYSCNNTEWLDKPIALELEHIDGNHQNNTLENLTILCPNCHAQTSTYRGKNIGKAV